LAIRTNRDKEICVSIINSETKETYVGRVLKKMLSVDYLFRIINYSGIESKCTYKTDIATDKKILIIHLSKPINSTLKEC
jgi:hypothetical protein